MVYSCDVYLQFFSRRVSNKDGGVDRVLYTTIYKSHLFSLIGHPIWRGRYTVWTLTISKRSNKVIESWSIVTLSYLNVRRSCKCSLWGFSSSEKHSMLYSVLHLPEVTSTEVKLIASVVLILSLLSVPCF